MRALLLAIVLFTLWLPRCQAQYVFMPDAQRRHVLDSLSQAMQAIQEQPVTFRRDTTLFFALERYHYHFFEIERPFAEKSRTMSLLPDSMYRIARRHKWPLGLVISLTRRGNAISWLGDKASAVKLYQEAIELARRHQLLMYQGRALVNLAVCFAYRKNITPADSQLAVRYMNQALPLARQTNDIEGIHQYYNLMGDFHIIRRQYAQALRFYEAERPLMMRHKQLSGYRTNLAYLGICYLHTGQEAKAKPLLDEFFARSTLDEGAYATHLHYTILAEISRYYLLNQRNYQQALRYQIQYERVLPQRPLFDASAHYETMVQIYSGLKQWDKAFAYQQRYMAARDSLKLEATGQRFAQIDHQLTLEQKQNQIRALQNRALLQQNQTQRTWLLFLGSMFAFFVCIAALLLYSNRLRKQAIDTKLELTQQQWETDARIIQTQEAERQRIATDLHDDLGGTLATLSRKITDARQRASNPAQQQLFASLEPLIQQGSLDLRRIAHNLMPPEFARLGLAAAVEQLVQAIPKQPTRFICIVSGKQHPLPVDTELNVYRIISELVQNVLKHASASQAAVQLLYYPAHLAILVEDNGRGIDDRISTHQSELNSAGIGFKSSSLRAEYIGATLRRDSGPGGTVVQLDVPYTARNAKPSTSHRRSPPV